MRDEYVAEGWPRHEAAQLAVMHLDSRLEAAARLDTTRKASRRLGLLMTADPGRARRVGALMGDHPAAYHEIALGLDATRRRRIVRK